MKRGDRKPTLESRAVSGKRFPGVECFVIDSTNIREGNCRMNESEQCEQCKPAKCCMYLTIQVEKPRTLYDFEGMLWRIAHQDIEYFVQEKKWYMMVHNPCRFHDGNSRCRIYESRPKVCRNHSTEKCEFDTPCDFELHIRSYEEMLRYASKKFKSLQGRLKQMPDYGRSDKGR